MKVFHVTDVKTAKKKRSGKERKFNVNNVLLPFGLFLICLLSDGIMAGKPGFFLDDWYIIRIYRTFGAAKFVEFF